MSSEKKTLGPSSWQIQSRAKPKKMNRVVHYTEDRVYGPVDLTVGEDIYDVMMHKLAGYFMLKPEAESRKLTPQTIRKRADSNVRGRSGSKISGHSLNVEWMDYDTGAVLHSEISVSKFVKNRMSELAEKSRQTVKEHRMAGKRLEKVQESPGKLYPPKVKINIG